MRKAVLFVVVAAGTMPLAPTTATAKGLFGVVQGGNPLSARDYATLGKSGTDTVRFGFNWNAVQPRADSAFNWSSLDVRIGRLAARGIRSFPTVSGSPSWISSKPKRPPIRSKREVRAWRSFLSAAVGRYGPDGVYWRTGGYVEVG